MAKKGDILVRLGARVRQLRKEKGWSQEALADYCQLDRTYVGGIERGERNVAVRNLERIARTLGLSLMELFRGV